MRGAGLKNLPRLAGKGKSKLLPSINFVYRINPVGADQLGVANGEKQKSDG
jgi:hypothetical protein